MKFESMFGSPESQSSKKEDEVQLMMDVVKLRRLLAKLNPVYVATHPFSKILHRTGGLIRGFTALVLCSLISMPLFASDYVLPPDQYVSPAITLEQASTTTPAASPSATAADSFYNLGPLSAPASSEPVTASTTPAYYVSASGSDQADGSAANPWKSISYAVSKLKEGDTLTIREGTYDLSAGSVFTASGRADARITIQGEGDVILDGSNLHAYTPVFDTKGQSFIDFKNLTVNNARAAVEVTLDSTYINVDGLKTDGNHFAVRVNGGSYVTVRNAYAINSRNAFRAEGNSHHLTYENIETYGAKDIYDGYDLNYTNGDGFIFELSVNNVTLRNIISSYNWDGGFDIKASNVLAENLVAVGNKNNFKLWGNNIVIKSSLSYNAKRQMRPDGTTVDGNGINVRSGTAKLVNMTFVDNEDYNIKINTGATVQLQNSIVVHQGNNGGYLLSDGGGTFLEDNNVWYASGRTASNAFVGSPDAFTPSPTDKYGDPGFVDWSKFNFRLTGSSMAIDAGNSGFTLSPYDLEGSQRVNGAAVDAGAYEYSLPVPVPTPTPVPTPLPTPVPGACTTAMCGVTEGQTVSGVIKIQPNLTLNPDIKKSVYYLNGSLSTREYSAPFTWGGTAGFDTTKLADGTYTLSGAYTTATGDKVFTFTIKVNNSTPAPVPTPVPVPTVCTTAMCGMTNGQTVSGTLKVQPNLTLNPDIKKVSYYLNGTMSGREYAAPFTWGGSGGIDTTKMADGTYTLSGAYTTSSGDKSFTMTFTVKNTAPAPAPVPTVCTTAICGVTEGQTVKGTISIKPNSALVPAIKKVAYYLNGTFYERVYAAPFAWGGTAGIDTTKLANGTYTLSGGYTTAAGDVNFTVKFTVLN